MIVNSLGNLFQGFVDFLRNLQRSFDFCNEIETILDSVLCTKHVREVSSRFEFFQKRFAPSNESTDEGSEPDAARGALSNGVFSFFMKGNPNK